MPRITPWGEIPDDGVVEIGEHTYAYYGGPPTHFSNSAIVVGEDSTLVFDANDVFYGRKLHAAVERYAARRPLRYLVLSHAHSDHVHGAHFFSPPARVLASRFTHERLTYWAARDLQPFIEETPQYAEEYRHLRIVIPDEIVEDVHMVDLGGLHVRLESVPTAHTPVDLFCVVEEDRIALCGDLLFNKCAAYIGSGSLQGSLAALDRLRRLDVSRYLPGHGPVCGREGLDTMDQFLQGMREAVRAGRASGLSGEALVADVRGRMERWRDLPFFNEPWMLSKNVPVVVRELEGSDS